MITRAFVRQMAAYNEWQNRSLYGAAATLGDDARRADRGAFWGSIHATLNHVMWGDTVWMSRFDGWQAPAAPMRQGTGLFEDFAALHAARAEADARIIAWARRVDDAWLAGELTWFSGAAGRELTRPCSLLVTHFFNHQTHHRGQVHAMLTAAGAKPEDTDLMLMQMPAA